MTNNLDLKNNTNKVSFQDIKKRIDYFIDTLENNQFNIDSFLKNYRNYNHHILNREISKLNDEKYLNLIYFILEKIAYYLVNKDHDSSKYYIEMFIDIYYFSRIDIYKSYKLFDIFIDLCLSYNNFFGYNNSNILKKWRNYIYLYIIEKKIILNNLKEFRNISFLDTNKKLEDLFEFNYFIKEPEDYNTFYEVFIPYDILKDIVVKSYTLIRNNRKEIHALYNELNKITYFILNNNELNTCFAYRLISIITLKNEMMIQYKIEKSHVDLYLNEVDSFINKRLYNNSKENFFSIFRSLGKIQFAYNLINCNSSVEMIYKTTSIKYHLENFINLSASEAQIESFIFQDIEVNELKIFFIPKVYDNGSYKLLKEKIMTRWRYRTYEKLGAKKIFVKIRNLFSKNKFNFIY